MRGQYQVKKWGQFARNLHIIVKATTLLNFRFFFWKPSLV